MKGQKLDIISLELSKLKNLLSPREFALTIIRPLYLELVSRLNSGESTPVQAEAVKSLLHFHSGHLLYHPHETKEKHSYHILIGGVPGEIHDIELSVMGLLCNHYNYRYTYLGSVISHEALIDIAHALEVHAVAFKSAGFQTQNYVEKLAHKLNPSIELLVVDNHEIETEKISSKRLQVFKTLDAFDDHLSKRIS